MQQYQVAIYSGPFGVATDRQTLRLYSRVGRASSVFYNLILGIAASNQAMHRIQSVCLMEPLICIVQCFPCIF